MLSRFKIGWHRRSWPLRAECVMTTSKTRRCDDIGIQDARYWYRNERSFHTPRQAHRRDRIITCHVWEGCSFSHSCLPSPYFGPNKTHTLIVSIETPQAGPRICTKTLVRIISASILSQLLTRLQHQWLTMGGRRNMHAYNQDEIDRYVQPISVGDDYYRHIDVVTAH